jgi:hypothetical protein
MNSRRLFLRTSLAVVPLLALDQQLIWKPEKQAEKEIEKFVKELRKSFRKMFRDDDLAWSFIGTPIAAATVTTQTEVVSQALRQADVYTSPSFSIPATISFIRLYANISLADKLSVGLQCSLDFQRSTDNGQTWVPANGSGWTSYGPDGYHAIGKDGTPIDNPDPSVAFNPQAYLGQLFRVVLTLPQPLTLGATVEITTG